MSGNLMRSPRMNLTNLSAAGDARPARRSLMPIQSVPGAHLSTNAVATRRLKPSTTMRPRAPGLPTDDAHSCIAGRAPINQTVAMAPLKPIVAVRPSARPAIRGLTDHMTAAGRAFFKGGRRR
jgi:hypothetical protein